MRRYASQRLLDADTGLLLSYQAVEINAAGEVTSITAFSQELPYTLWSDGLLLISSMPVTLHPCETFASFSSRLRHSCGKPHLYVITPFDLHRMEFTPSSRIIVL